MPAAASTNAPEHSETIRAPLSYAARTASTRSGGWSSSTLAQAGTTTVSAATSASSPWRPLGAKPAWVRTPLGAHTRRSYQGLARSWRVSLNTSHGMASSKIGTPLVAATATRWARAGDSGAVMSLI